MFYFLSILLIFPLMHSVVIFLRKNNNGKEPFWLKAYTLSASLYTILISIIVVRKLLIYFNASNSIQAYAMLATGLLVFFILIKIMPKKEVDFWE